MATPATLAGFTTEVAEMQKQQYFLTAFKENFGSQDGTSTEELASIKERFSKMKFNFIELNSKERFLELLAGKDDALPTADAVQETERHVGEAKQTLKETKATVEEQKKSLEGLVHSTAAKYAEMSARYTQIQALIDQTAQLEQQVLDEEHLANEHLVALDQQHQQTQLQIDATRKLQIELQILNSTVAVAVASEEVQLDLPTIPVPVVQAPPEDPAQASLRDQIDWYNNMTTLVAALSH